MERDQGRTVERRIRNLEEWQEAVAPMLKQLADDQAYRHRWQQERNSSRARWRRSVSWTVAVIGGAIVATASIVSLVHALL